MSAVLALFALAAGNDLSDLRVDAGGAGSGSSAASTTPTSVPDDGGARVTPGTGSTLPGGGTGTGGVPAGTGTGTGQPGVGGAAPGGGIVTASTEANAGAGVLGSSTTAQGGLPGIPTDTGLDATGTTADGAADASLPDGQTATGDTAAGSGTTTQAGQTDGAGGAAAPGATTAGGSSAGQGAGSGGSTNATTAATSRGGNGSGSGLAATLRLIAIMIAFGASAAGVAWLAASLVRAILSGRRQRRPDEEDDGDDELEALVVIDHASAGWTLEQLRRRLEAEPDPRLAIREAYSVVESGFGIGGGLARRRTETALQYLERTLGMIEGGTKPLRVLTGLFLLARFSNRPMNEAMRRAAIDAVVELQSRFRAAEELAA